MAVRNEPGTLLAVLRVIADHGLNMRKLESRPSRERAWEYVFWIDLDGEADDPAMHGGARRPRARHDDGPACWAATRRRALARAAGARPQISLVQALQRVASTAFASLQNGQVFTSAAGASLMNSLG